MASTSRYDEAFAESCKNLILLSANGALTDEDEDLIDLMSECSKHFLKKLVTESADNAETSEITYDDITEVVHSNDNPWLVILRESFRQRITFEEILNRRNKTMKSLWFFDYTHYNKQNKDDEQQPKTPKASSGKESKQEKLAEKPKIEHEDNAASDSNSTSGSPRKRKIIPKKQFYD